MADPYNVAIQQAHDQLRAALTPPAPVGPAALPPQFVGRYAGAPLPQQAAPAPVTPYVPPPAGAPATPGGMPQMGWPMALPYTAAQANATPAPAPAAPAGGYLPRFDMNSPAVRAAVGAPVPSATTAPGVVQPANAASTPTTMIRGIGIGGVPVDIPAPTAAPAPTLAAMSAVGHMDDFNNPAGQQQQRVGQSPQIGPDGQWDVQPLPEGMIGDEGGATDASYPGQGTWAATTMNRQGTGYGGISTGRGGVMSGGGLVDPEARINAGFDRQTATANDFMSKALDYIQQGGNIFERATRGRAIGNILHAVMGPNNVGQVQGQGIDSLNSATAGIDESANYANANIHGSDNSLLAHVMSDQTENRKLDTDSVVMGSDIRQDPYTKMGMVVPVYGQRPQQAGQSPKAYDAAPSKPTREQFLQRARQANPGKSDEELSAYYNKTYGN